MSKDSHRKSNRSFLNTGTGIAFGAAFGLILLPPAYGLVIGAALGLLIGALADAQNKKMS